MHTNSVTKSADSGVCMLLTVCEHGPVTTSEVGDIEMLVKVTHGHTVR